MSSFHSTTALFLYFILHPNSLEFVQGYADKYLIARSYKFFYPYFMVFVNFYGMNSHIVDDLKLWNDFTECRAGKEAPNNPVSS